MTHDYLFTDIECEFIEEKSLEEESDARRVAGQEVTQGHPVIIWQKVGIAYRCDSCNGKGTYAIGPYSETCKACNGNGYTVER